MLSQNTLCVSLQPVDFLNDPFKRWGIYLLGPFPRFVYENRWYENRSVIVASNHLTRYVEADVLPNGSSVEVTKLFIGRNSLRPQHSPRSCERVRYKFSTRTSCVNSACAELVARCALIRQKTTAHRLQIGGTIKWFNSTLTDRRIIHLYRL